MLGLIKAKNLEIWDLFIKKIKNKKILEKDKMTFKREKLVVNQEERKVIQKYHREHKVFSLVQSQLIQRKNIQEIKYIIVLVNKIYE